MEKTVYLTCGKAFKDYETAIAYICSAYTPTFRWDSAGNFKEAGFAAVLRQIAKGEYKAVPHSLKLPPSVSLKDKMRPVRNQASRGTCAANAGAALMEYYEGGGVDLSVQYLYERMKREERDDYRKAAVELANGQAISNPILAETARRMLADHAREAVSPVDAARAIEETVAQLYHARVEMDGGSSAKYLVDVLKKFGVCREEFWPYAREQLDEKALVTDWDNHSVPPGADEDALHHRLCDSEYEFAASNNVEELKKYLAGDSYHEAMPIYVGVRLFADGSSSLPLQDGFVRLPKITTVKIEKGRCKIGPAASLASECDISGVDPDSVMPCDSVDVLDMKLLPGGHAMLLVGYVDDESVLGGGYFIIRNSWGGDWGEDGYGKLPYAYAELFITSAMTIIRRPVATAGNLSSVAPDAVPDDLKIYIRTAERDFEDSHGVISIPKGKRIIVDEDDVAELDNELNRKKFRDRGYSWRGKVVVSGGAGEKGDEKVVSSQEAGRFFSGIESGLKRLPFAFPIVGSIKKIGLFPAHPKVEKAVCVEDYTARLGEKFKIYDVTGGKFRVRVAVAYLSSNENAGEASEKVRELLEEYDSQQRFSKADCRLTVIGATGAIADLVPAYANHEDVRVVADEYVTGKGWRPHAVEMKDPAWHEWLKRLVPNMSGEWTRSLSEEWQAIADSIGGHVTLGKLAERVDLPPAALAAFVGEFLPGYKVKGDKVMKA